MNKFVYLKIFRIDIPGLFKVLNLTRRELKSWHKEYENNSYIVISYKPRKEELKHILGARPIEGRRFLSFCNLLLLNMIELLLIFPGIYFCFNKYKYLVDSGTSQDIVWKFTINLTNYTQSKDTWMVIGELLKLIPDNA